MKRLLGAALLLALVAAPMALGNAGHEKIGGPDPVTAEWTEWPHETSCDGGLRFNPVAAFSGPTNAEKGSLPSEKALRRFLAQDILTWVRKRSWRLVVEKHGIAEFASGRLLGELEWMTFRRARGRWKWEGYSSDCEAATLRHGRDAITWTLDPDQPQLGPETDTILVDLGPSECSGGKPAAPRLQKPEFREQNGALLMTLWLRPLPPGGYTCEGVIEPPVKIELPEPLGTRPLMDGGTYPPSLEQLRFGR